MKLHLTFTMLLSAAILIISCGKDEETPIKPVDPIDSTSTEINNRFVRFQMGLEDDTVQFFTYDADNRLKSIIDSGATEYPMNIHYNKAGLVDTVVDILPSRTIKYTFTYTSDNQPFRIDSKDEGTFGRIQFTYTNGVPVKRAEQYSRDGITYEDHWRWEYTVKDSNIVKIKQYDDRNELVDENNFTFTNEPNIFKPLNLLDVYYFSGLFDAGYMDAYFNKNMMATNNRDGSVTTYTYTYNDKKQLVKFVRSNTEGFYDRGIFTRLFSY